MRVSFLVVPCLGLFSCSSTDGAVPGAGGTASVAVGDASGSLSSTGMAADGTTSGGGAENTTGSTSVTGSGANDTTGSAGTLAAGGSATVGSGGSGAMAGASTTTSLGGSASDTSDQDDGLPEPASSEALCQYLEGLAPPLFDRAELVSWWEAFASDYSDRSHGTQENLAASEYLQSELNAAGYSTVIRELDSIPGSVRVVEGIKAGSELPEQHIALTAHYDMVTTTTMGAYDNASGVAAALQICRLLAQVDTRKSVACLFFDAEDLGAFGSLEYVSEVVVPSELSVEQVFGYDMVGLNYPAMPWKLYAFLGLDTVALRPLVPTHSSLLNSVLFGCLGDALDVHDEGFELIPTNERNSDEAAFMLEDIPVLRFAGGRTAAEYNGYHNEMDTVENIYELAGSRADFENGMAMVVDVSYYAIRAFDLYDPFDMPDLCENGGCP